MRTIQIRARWLGWKVLIHCWWMSRKADHRMVVMPGLYRFCSLCGYDGESTNASREAQIRPTPTSR